MNNSCAHKAWKKHAQCYRKLEISPDLNALVHLLFFFFLVFSRWTLRMNDLQSSAVWGLLCMHSTVFPWKLCLECKNLLEKKTAHIKFLAYFRRSITSVPLTVLPQKSQIYNVCLDEFVLFCQTSFASPTCTNSLHIYFFFFKYTWIKDTPVDWCSIQASQIKCFPSPGEMWKWEIALSLHCIICLFEQIWPQQSFLLIF